MCVDICFFIAFLVYPGNSAIIFAVYSCENFDDGTSFLKADYSIDCNDPAHAVMLTYATLMFIVYPIGYAPAICLPPGRCTVPYAVQKRCPDSTLPRAVFCI